MPPFYPIFACVDLEYGSRSRKLLNTDPIWIRIHNTACTYAHCFVQYYTNKSFRQSLSKAWAQFQTVSRLQDQRVSASHEVHTGICSFEEGKNRTIFLNKKNPYIPAVQNCLTLNTFICQRKSQIMLKKNKTSKNVPMLAMGNAATNCWQNTPNINNSVYSHVVSTDFYGIVKTPARPSGGLE